MRRRRTLFGLASLLLGLAWAVGLDSPAAAEPPPDDTVVWVCSPHNRLALQVGPDGAVETGEDTGPASHWQLDVQDDGRYRLRSVATGLWLHNSSYGLWPNVTLRSEPEAERSQWRFNEPDSGQPDRFFIENTAWNMFGRVTLTADEDGLVMADSDHTWELVEITGDGGCYADAEIVAVDKHFEVGTDGLVVERYLAGVLAGDTIDGVQVERQVGLVSIVDGATPNAIDDQRRLAIGSYTSGQSDALFTYRLAIHGASDTATVEVVEIDIPIQPFVANPDFFTVAVGVELVGPMVDLQLNDLVPDGFRAYELVSGSLPPGTILQRGGELVGRPTVPGTYSFTYRTSTRPDRIGSVMVEVVPGVFELVDDTRDAIVGVRPSGRLLWGRSLLDGAVTDVELVDGALPPGIVQSPSGYFGGAPTTAGTFVATYRITTSSGSSDTMTLTHVVVDREADLVANDDTLRVAVGQAVDLSTLVLANDTLDGFTTSTSTFELVDGGPLPLQPQRFQPPFWWLGTIDTTEDFSFTYRITGEDGSSETATVDVLVGAPASHVFEGQVTDAVGEGVPGVAVRIRLASTSIWSSTTTDATGGFRFDEAPAGRVEYQLDLPDGYAWADDTGQLGTSAFVGFSWFADHEAGAVVNVQRRAIALTATVAGTATIPDDPNVVAKLDVYRQDRSVFHGSQVLTDGPYELDLPAGTYQLTFVLNNGPVWPNGSRYLTEIVTLADGDRFRLDIPGGDTTPPRISATVTTEAGDPVDAMPVDLFTTVGPGVRGDWLGAQQTGEDGAGTAIFQPGGLGCYTLVFIGQDRWTFGGAPYHEQEVCVTAGSPDVDFTVTVDRTDNETGTVSGQVISSGTSPTVGIVVDLFDVAADGSRGGWRGDVVTGPDGRFEFSAATGFDLGPDACVVIVAIAPDGERFATGSAWWQEAGCGSPTFDDIVLE